MHVSFSKHKTPNNNAVVNTGNQTGCLEIKKPTKGFNYHIYQCNIPNSWVATQSIFLQKIDHCHILESFLHHLHFDGTYIMLKLAYLLFSRHNST